MHFYLFSRLSIQDTWSEGAPLSVPLPRLRKVQGLLAYLLLFRDRPHARDHLAALFWGDVPDDRARSSLSVALHSLRKLLTGTGAALETDRLNVQLHSGTAWIDVAELQRALQKGRSPGRDELDRLLRLYTGDLLEGWAEEWCIEERERLRQAVLKKGAALVREYLAAEEWTAGAEMARHLLRHDPLDSELHDLLLRLLLGSGEHEQARRHYRDFAGLLRTELDMEPPPSTQRLYAETLHSATTGPALAPARHSSAAGAAPVGPASAGPGTLSFRLPFAGRMGERRALQRALAVLGQGQGGIVLVRGEAGAGKSRLVEEALAEAGAARVLRVARGRCSEVGRDVSFAPLLQPLAHWLLDDLAPAQVLQRLGPTGAAGLAQILPALGAKLPNLRPLPALPPEEAHTRLLGSVVAAVLAAVRPQSPAVLYLEDLHWADSYTLQVLEQLAGHPADVPLLVIGTYRSDEVAGRGALARMAERIQTEPAGRLLDVPLLTGEEVRAIIEPRIRQEAGELSRWLYTQSRGNAFYLAELLRGLLEEERAVADGATGGWRLVRELPSSGGELRLSSVQAAVLERFERLSEGGQTVVRVAAALAEASFELLWAATGLSEDAALAGLEEGLARRFLRQQGGGEADSATATDVSYAPAHDLLGQAIYAALSAPRRVRLHEQIGAALEQTLARQEPPPAGCATPTIMQLAHHYGRTNNRAKQRCYFRMAAARAQEEYANTVAIGYYRRLLPLLAPAEQAAVMLRLGQVLNHIGEWQEAQELYAQAIQEAGAQADTLGVAHAQIALGALLNQRGANAEALVPLQQAYAILAVRRDGQYLDLDGLLQVLDRLGHVALLMEEYRPALGYFTQQLELAREAGDRVSVGGALNSIGRVYIDQGDGRQALPYLNDALEIALATDDLNRQLLGYWALGHYYTMQRDYRQALAWYIKTAQIATRIGNLRATSVTLSGMGLAYFNYGDLENAGRCYALHLKLSLQLGNRNGTMIGTANMASLYSAQGRRAVAEPIRLRAIRLARLLDRAYYLAEYLYYYAEECAEEGRFAEARRFNAEAGACAARVAHTEFVLRSALQDVRLAFALGEVARDAAVAQCRQLLSRQTDDLGRAGALYRIWQIDPAQEDVRQAAAALYRDLYLAQPTQEARRRYADLTGDRVPAPPPLPPLPAGLAQPVKDLGPLLEAVDRLAAELSAE